MRPTDPSLPTHTTVGPVGTEYERFPLRPDDDVLLATAYRSRKAAVHDDEDDNEEETDLA